MNIAIILASGQGKRMGAGRNKVLLTIGRKPLLYYTLSAFERCERIDKILVTGRDEDIPTLKDIVRKNSFGKVSDFVLGGKERQDSGYNALRHLQPQIKDARNTYILFHNGANPFVTGKEITDTIDAARQHGACAVAHPTKDTIKEVGKKGLVIQTLDRSVLRNMQTPQTIRFDIALKAFESAQQANYIGTDDVSLVERLGKKVAIIDGSHYNFKVTTPLDLEVAKIIIKREQLV